MKTILEMIENVSPDDTDTLDEIDVRAAEYITGKLHAVINHLSLLPTAPRYTRSRDALKAIRPEGAEFLVEVSDYSSFCLASNEKFSVKHTAPTEELAELHAIIQAIEWERNNE